MYLSCLSAILTSFAVDVSGNHIAVVRRKNLSILSSSLKEKLCISLSLDSWNEDCNVEGMLPLKLMLVRESMLGFCIFSYLCLSFLKCRAEN